MLQALKQQVDFVKFWGLL